ncbi:MAG TPA: GDSL-type esterase/lipase family protein [Planctomycetota bacterium]|jgi:lysophospholipase L1-like esterase|nr:GDSL-type esterase/lipase family protein [Planctomycetota bacterium]
MGLLRFVGVMALLGELALLQAAPAPRAEFPLKTGDVWVMAGDSITAQHLHSNYFEAFCYARYPNLKFAFRNSGVGGHTIPTTLARFEYDIAAWNPTVVSVELGMNDKGGTPTDKFVANMGTMVERIRGIKARPIVLSASPVNNGDTMAKLGGNQRLHEYAVALKEFSAKENIPFADQFHLLLDLWGNNKPRENIANSINALKLAAADDSTAGVEHLRAFLAAQEKSPVKPLSMQGDAVHPGPPGQLMMAAALLKELGADGFVSSVAIDAAGKTAEAKGCKVEGLTADGSKVEFDRLDERCPFPIPDDARQVLAFYPTILELSQYTLKVAGLKGTSYSLKINGVPSATVTAAELEAGVNLTSFGALPQSKEASPIVAQMRAILGAVSAKEGLVGQWRSLSQKAHAAGADPALKEQLAALTKKVEEADGKIREAARPQKLHFELASP